MTLDRQRACFEARLRLAPQHEEHRACRKQLLPITALLILRCPRSGPRRTLHLHAAPSPSLQRLDDPGDIPDRPRRAGRAVGDVFERLHGEPAVIAGALQGREHRREGVAALARPSPVRIVELDMGDKPGGDPALDCRRDRLGLGHRRRRRVDHGAQRRVADAADDRGGVGDGVDEVGLARRQRLDAIGHARRLGFRGNRGPGGFRSRRRSGIAADAPLRRRAVHEIIAAEIGAKLDEPPHHLDGPLPRCPIGGRDREPFWRDEKPVQAADRDPRLRACVAHGGTLGGRHSIAVLAEREGRELEPGIAKLGGERALPSEGQLANDLVAQRKLHRRKARGAGGAALINRPVTLDEPPAPGQSWPPKFGRSTKPGGMKHAQVLQCRRRRDARIVRRLGRRPGLPVEARPPDHADRALGRRRLDRPDGAHRRDRARIRAQAEGRGGEPARRLGLGRHQGRARGRQGRLHLGGRRRGRHRRLQGSRAPRQPAQGLELFFAVANVNTVAANPSAPFKDFGQFLETLKKSGKDVPVATAGLSSAGHNMMETIRKSAPGVEYRHVTYDGGNPAVLSAVSGETQAAAQLLVEMSEFIKGKRLIPLAVQADKPVVLDGYGEIPPVTKWLPNMPAPLNYFGIWAPKGTPEPVVQTMDMIWKKKIANSEPLKKYAAARAALFTPLSGDDAAREAMKMVTQTVWLYFDAGKAKASPDTIGIARPQ